MFGNDHQALAAGDAGLYMAVWLHVGSQAHDHHLVYRWGNPTYHGRISLL